MNWIAFAGLAGAFLAQALAVAFFFGSQSNRLKVAEERRAEDKTATAERISEMTKAGERDDSRLTKEFDKLEQQIEKGFEYWGERLGHVGETLVEHDKRITKLERGTFGSTPRLAATREPGDPRRD